MKSLCAGCKYEFRNDFSCEFCDGSDYERPTNNSARVFEKGKSYVCVAKCPELDRDSSRHCHMIITTNEGLALANDFECPCGNKDLWDGIKV